jgi:hypothetical protein
MASKWLKNDGATRLTDYIVGVGVGLVIASAIAGNHKSATALIIVIGCALVVVSLIAYVTYKKTKGGK